MIACQLICLIILNLIAVIDNFPILVRFIIKVKRKYLMAHPIKPT